MNPFQKIKLRSLERKAKNLQAKRERGENIDVRQEIKTQLQLAEFYTRHRFDKKLPHAEVYISECYRAAALLGDAEAQYLFAKNYIEKAKFWDNFATTLYANLVHKTYAKNYYDEAFSFLTLSEAGGYALARRLHGMAYINGWGVEKDKDKGFKLIVQSIEEENAWDKATKIFEELGLNSPEFFSSIMALRERK